jgi:hypothetical protein
MSDHDPLQFCGTNNRMFSTWMPNSDLLRLGSRVRGLERGLNKS